MANTVPSPFTPLDVILNRQTSLTACDHPMGLAVSGVAVVDLAVLKPYPPRPAFDPIWPVYALLLLSSVSPSCCLFLFLLSFLFHILCYITILRTYPPFLINFAYLVVRRASVLSLLPNNTTPRGNPESRIDRHHLTPNTQHPSPAFPLSSLSHTLFVFTLHRGYPWD
ncbi:hypothetical protein BDV10DRAFT_41373 [Aspergillus recurvatus]